MDRSFDRFVEISTELKSSRSSLASHKPTDLKRKRSAADLPWWASAMYGLTYFGIRVVAGAVRIMPLDMATWLAGNLHRLYSSWGGRHARVLANLERAFPGKSVDERQAIGAAMWQNIGRTAAEGVRLERFLSESDRVDVLGTHFVDRCYDEKGPTICVTLHSGNWELAMLPFALRGLKPTAVYKQFANPYLDRYVTAQREKVQIGGLLPMGGDIRESAAVLETSRRLISHVRQGGPIGFLADHHDRKGILVPFFGHAVRSTKVPAMLARHFGARLLIGRTVRLGRQSRFLLEIKELEVARTANRAADIRAATVAMQRQFEVWIREFPEQWSWTRARFTPGMHDKAVGASATRKLSASVQRDTLPSDKSDPVVLLGQCLAFEEAAFDPAALRHRIASEDGVWGEIVAAALRHGLLPAVADRLAAKGLLPPEPRGARPTALSPARQLQDHLTSHRERRKAQRAHLIEIVRELNSRGIECILLRDAQTLWLKEPEWRHLRSLEILTAACEWATTQATLIRLGYQQCLVKRMGNRLWPSRKARFVKPEFPGWIDIHLGYNRNAESLLPIAEVVAKNIPVAEEGVRVRLLPPPLFILDALIGRHYARRPPAHEISLEGLYQFAWWMAHRATQDGNNMRKRAAQDPRLLAALNFWVAASVDLFCLKLQPPFSVYPHATEEWLQAKRQIGSRLQF
jgi:KDO2-lipid IV(A) lauroyltransferase